MLSDNIRASLRNLWINSVVSVLILGVCFISGLFKITAITPKLDQIIYWAIIAALIAWIAFLAHCCGEMILELRRRNYHYLWSFLPFVLPLISLLARNGILAWLTSKVDVVPIATSWLNKLLS